MAGSGSPSVADEAEVEGPGPSSLAAFGALIADPVRAAILLRLSDGSRRPAGELAWSAGASPQAASAHLAKLLAGGLIASERQGRHRFYRIASGDVAERLEDLANWIDRPARAPRHDPDLCRARLCYDHVAGALGVAILERMTARGMLVLDPGEPTLSEAGRRWCEAIGIEASLPGRSRRPEIRLCLDWTERRPHLGGRLGAALAKTLLDRGHVVRAEHGRALRITGRGADAIRRMLGDDLDR